MARLDAVCDEDGNRFERPSRHGMWVGGIEHATTARARFSFAPYSAGDLTGVYRLYACDGTLLYIGVTNDPLRRWKQHAATKSWWTEVDHIVLIPFGSATSARYMERQIIRSESPLYNVQHARQRS